MCASVSIVIPAYNEASSLADLFRRVIIAAQNCGIDYEVILCDDASSDGTKAIMQSLEKSSSHVKAIYHTHNQGLFKTFDELYNAASKEFVLLLPGDGQWDPGLLPKVLERVPACDVVIAARKHKKYPLGRQINSWMFNWLVRVCFGVDLYDIGSVKLVRREIYSTIALTTQSAFTEAERLIKAEAQGYTIGAIWVEHIARAQGTGKGATPDKILRAFGDLIAFRLKWKGTGHAQHRGFKEV